MSVKREKKLSKRALRDREYHKRLSEESGVAVSENIEMKSEWRGMRYIVNGLTAFMGSFGAVECFLSSLSIEHNAVMTAFVLFLVSLYIAAIYYRFKNLGYFLFILVYLRTILHFRVMANSGFATILNRLQLLLSRELGIPASSRYVESVSDTEQAVTIVSIYIGCLVVVLLNIAITEYMNVGDMLFVTFPVAQIGMLFGFDASPAAILPMLFSWLFVGVLKSNFHFRLPKKKQNAFSYKRKSHTHFIRYRTDSRANTELILAVGTFLLVLSLVLTLFVPNVLIRSIGEFNSWREDSIMEARRMVESGFEDFFGRQGAGGVNGGKLGEVSTVRFDNQTDLRVRMAPYKADRMYFKAYTGTNYTGRTFDVTANEEWKKWRESELSTNAEEINKASFYTLKGRAEDDTEADSPYYQGKVKITNLGANNDYLYLPYYSNVRSAEYHEEGDRSIKTSKPRENYIISQDDLIYNKTSSDLSYSVNFVDRNLSLKELDEILVRQNREGKSAVLYAGTAKMAKEIEDYYSEMEEKGNMPEGDTLLEKEIEFLKNSKDVVDKTNLFLCNRDGSNPESILYLEKDYMKYEGYGLEASKKLSSDYLYKHRYLLRDAYDYNENNSEYNALLSVGAPAAMVLKSFGEKRSGISDEDLKAGMDRWKNRYEEHGGFRNESFVLDHNNKVVWRSGLDGIQNFSDKIGKRFIGINIDYVDKLSGLSVMELVEYNDKKLRREGDILIDPVYSEEDADAHAVGLNQEKRYKGILNNNMEEAIRNSESAEMNTVNCFGMADGSRVELKDSLSDYYYRGYIAEKNLQIPEQTLPALREFCREYGINAGDENVVQKVAAALEDNFRYVLNPGATPYDEDFVSYFLQEQKQGFCVHFAAASALLFRYLGIPSRYCEGYVADYVDMFSGTLVSGENLSAWVDHTESSMGETAVLDVDITDANAHAWTEIYLDDYGWVPVDLTPASDIESDFDSFWEEFNSQDDEEDNGGTGFLQDIGMRVLSNVISLRIAFFLFVLLPCFVLLYLGIKGIYIRRRKYQAWHGEDEAANVMVLYRQVLALAAAVGCRWENGMSYHAFAELLQEKDYLAPEEISDFVENIEHAAFAEEITEADMPGRMLVRLQRLREDLYHRQGWFRRMRLKYVRNL